MTTEWPTIDPSVEGEHTSNLFDGDLFSDELLDMYNPSVAPMTNILPNDNGEDPNARGQGIDYDGLGAFRPSNSINDFTSILENNNTVLPSPAKVAENEQETAVINVNHLTVHPAASSSVTANPVAAPILALVPSVVTPTPIAAAVGKKRPRDESQPPQPSQKKIVVKEHVTVVAPVPVVSSIVLPQVPRIVQPVDHLLAIPLLKNNATHATKIHVVSATAFSTDNLKGKVVTPEAILVQSAPVPNVVNSAPDVVTVQPPVIHGNHIVGNVAKVVPSVHPKDACSVGSVKTEESFKGVAQAAVTNLILSAGSTTSRKEDTETVFSKPVDTSTAHVAALTSNNWVAACAASISGAPPGTAQAAQAAALAAASDPAAAKAARARRATLTADERARQNRDRNREHARNTRLRKKAYVEELKRTLTELVTQRDATDVEKRHEKQRDLEVREVRYRVMEEFLKLRARGAEQNLLARWVAILEDGFTLTLPKVEYRAMAAQEQYSSLSRRVSGDGASVHNSGVDATKQVLRGANQSFDDAVKVASFIVSAFMGNAVQMTYHCERTHFMMDGVKAILDWTLRATPQNSNGEAAAPSFVLQGCMRATFSPASNKLASAELLFDTGAVAAQIKSIKSQQSFCAVEETDALLDSLPHIPAATLPSSVSVVSTDKDASSNEGVEMSRIKVEPQTA